MTHTHTKDQGQRSVGSKDTEWKQTDGRTEPIALRSVLTRSVHVCRLQFLITSNIPFSALIIAVIAVDRYVCICHPLRYATFATAARARLVVLLLALLTLVLGLLGAAGFSVYHSVPIRAVSTTPHDGHLDHATTTSSSFADADDAVAERDTCVTPTNGTVCATKHAFLNTGLCGRTQLILSASFLHGYLVVHSLIYPFCLLTVLVLYSLIYHSVLVRRSRRLRMRAGPVISLARRPTPTPASQPPVDKSAAGNCTL